MCGIVGCIGVENAQDFIVSGLSRLEYRGYDSAGLAIISQDGIQVTKKQGMVAEMERQLVKTPLKGSIGIGHTRWATHGEPNDINAHPHVSSSGRFAVVHNGIIENYALLKQQLERRGISQKSQTDTEVLVNLIESIAERSPDISSEEAVRLALKEVVGAYAIAVLDNQTPQQIVVARKSSPLVVGVGEEGSYYVASDATPIIEFTSHVMYLEDGDMAVLKKGQDIEITSIADAKTKSPFVEELEMDIQAIEKAGYEHFMLKEIFEQPQAITDSLRGRVLADKGIIKLGGIEEYEDQIIKAKRIIIVACGTSWHAGLVGEYYIEQLARIPVEVEYASEFRYRQPIIGEGDIVIAISQSGETADTLAAIDLAKQRGALALGICNVAGSSIARATDAGIYTHAGPEISVASTKAFTTQISVLLALAARLAILRGTIGQSRLRTIASQLHTVPKHIETILKNTEHIETIAQHFADMDSTLFMGRGLSFPVALEGALKLKEISYIHAEGYASGELKHGPIALIDDQTPTIIITPHDSYQEKTVSNMQEIKARKGHVLAIVTKGDAKVAAQADWSIEVPVCDELLYPLLTSVPLQLLAYYVAKARGCEIDRPRNLAKSVTVE